MPFSNWLMAISLSNGSLEISPQSTILAQDRKGLRSWSRLIICCQLSYTILRILYDGECKERQEWEHGSEKKKAERRVSPSLLNRSLLDVEKPSS